jgi:hypothetical protein
MDGCCLVAPSTGLARDLLPQLPQPDLATVFPKFLTVAGGQLWLQDESGVPAAVGSLVPAAVLTIGSRHLAKPPNPV